MNLKEHLVFLTMMIPTILLLIALVASLAFAGLGAGAPSGQLALATAVAAEEPAGDEP
jgi:hypothetical protein